MTWLNYVLLLTVYRSIKIVLCFSWWCFPSDLLYSRVFPSEVILSVPRGSFLVVILVVVLGTEIIDAFILDGVHSLHIKNTTKNAVPLGTAFLVVFLVSQTCPAIRDLPKSLSLCHPSHIATHISSRPSLSHNAGDIRCLKRI